MIKIGMLTSHASMNYGALLQAYALKKVLKDMGCECNIINYKPQMHNMKEHPIQFVVQRKDIFQKVWSGLRNYNSLKKRIELTEDFRNHYLTPEPINTLSAEEIAMEASKYDVICCGSDQLWNLNQKDNENRAYMLDFERQNFSMSYAVSFGDGLQKKKKEIEESLPLIKKFDALSVRDYESLKFLKEHNINAEIAIDPTLLIDESEWNSLKCEALVKEPYILVYGFENATQRYDDLINAAKRIAGDLKLPIVNPIMGTAIERPEFNNMCACGPIEFLNLVENAAFVCTNSFHGTIFSIIKKKPFASVFGTEINQDIRKTALLSMLHLEERAITPFDKWDIAKLMETNYDMAFQQLYIERQRSKAFLQNALYRFKEGKK